MTIPGMRDKGWGVEGGGWGWSMVFRHKVSIFVKVWIVTAVVPFTPYTLPLIPTPPLIPYPTPPHPRNIHAVFKQQWQIFMPCLSNNDNNA